VRMSSPSTCSPLRLDPVHGRRRVLVLPHPHDDPSVSGECTIVPRVSFPSGLDLGSPPFGIGLRRDGVLWAPVPEASVDLYRDPRTAQNDVWSTGEVPDVHSESESATVELPPYRKLGPGPRRGKARHEAGDSCGRRRRTRVTRAHG
jgi:hypothetical protein